MAREPIMKLLEGCLNWWYVNAIFDKSSKNEIAWGKIKWKMAKGEGCHLPLYHVQSSTEEEYDLEDLVSYENRKVLSPIIGYNPHFDYSVWVLVFYRK